MEQLKLNDFCFIAKLAGFEYAKYFSRHFQESGIPLIQGENIKNYSLDLSDDHYVSEEKSDSLPRSQADNNSLFFCYVYNIADCWINIKNLKLQLRGNVAQINVIDKRLDPKYLFYWFQSPIHKNYIVQTAKGSAQKNINMEKFRNIDIVLPDLLARHHIVNTVRNCL